MAWFLMILVIIRPGNKFVVPMHDKGTFSCSIEKDVSFYCCNFDSKNNYWRSRNSSLQEFYKYQMWYGQTTNWQMIIGNIISKDLLSIKNSRIFVE